MLAVGCWIAGRSGLPHIALQQPRALVARRVLSVPVSRYGIPYFFLVGYWFFFFIIELFSKKKFTKWKNKKTNKIPRIFRRLSTLAEFQRLAGRICSKLVVQSGVPFTISVVIIIQLLLSSLLFLHFSSSVFVFFNF